MQHAFVRDRRDSDLPAAAKALEEAYLREDYPVEGVSNAIAWLTPEGMLNAWTALVDDLVVGQATLTTPNASDSIVDAWVSRGGDREQTVVLRRLFLGDAGLGHGLGRQLTNAARDWARQRGLVVVFDVMSHHERAIRMYERLGWKKIASSTHDGGVGKIYDCYIYVDALAWAKVSDR